METVAPITVKLTTKDIDDINRNGKLSTDAANNVLAFIIASVQSNIRSLETTDTEVKKSKKKRKPRKPTPFNLFSKENKAKITAQLGEGKQIRGAFIKKAGEMWKALTEEEKAQYQPIVLVNPKIQPATDEEIKQYVKVSKVAKTVTKKPRKPRGPTPFNRFVSMNKADIKTQLGEEVKVRGAFTKKAGELWKAMTDDQKAVYNGTVVE